MSSVWNKDISSVFPRSACGYRDKYFKKKASQTHAAKMTWFMRKTLKQVYRKKHIILNTEQEVLTLLKPLRLMLCGFSSACAGIGIGTCLCIKHQLY